MKYHNFFNALLSLLIFTGTLPGCINKIGNPGDLEDRIDDIVNRGGVAAFVSAGEVVNLKVEDVDSPIFGAAVAWDATALPAKVDRAFLSLEPISNSVDLPASIISIGRGVEINLIAVEARAPVSLSTDSRVSLPVSAGLVGTNDALAVAHLTEAGLVVLAETQLGSEPLTISGLTKKFSPFIAIRSPGNCVETNPDAQGSAVATRTFSFDSDGRLLTIAETTASGNPGENKLYEYKKNGRLSSIVSTDNQGAPIITKDYLYDASGHLTATSNGIQLVTFEYAGSSVSKALLFSGGTTIINTFKYSDGLLSTQSQVDPTNEQISLGNVTYNYTAGVLTLLTQDGNPTQMIAPDGSDDIFIQWQNENGLATQQTLFQDGGDGQPGGDDTIVGQKTYSGCSSKFISQQTLFEATGFMP